MSLADLQADIRLRRARRRAIRVALLRAMGGAPHPFAAPCLGLYDGKTALVHRDTYADTAGRWRFTIFDAAGPLYHRVCGSWSEAAEDVSTQWGAELRLARDPRV